MRNIEKYSGNRTNLRSKSYNQIHRIGGVSYILGALGDFLVTTWINAIMAILIFAVGIFFIFFCVKNAGIAIIAQNVMPIILMVIGLLLVTINVVMTNPVQGAQIIVSTKFLKNKFHKIGYGSKNRKVFKPFRFLEGDESNAIVEASINNKHYYMMAYTVRGTVSPVTFDSDLEISANADAGLLKNIERDSLIVTTINVEKTEVRKRPLPKNATPAMINKRNMQYNLTSNIPNNQQLKITLIIVSPTLELLRERNNQLVSAFNRGMVIGYNLLTDKETKKRFNSIFG